MISSYDPLKAPDPDNWLALDESQRNQLVLQYHRQAGIEVANEKIHAVIHVIVENQAAQEDLTPVNDALQRLMDEGLDRHGAIHAIGSVLIKHMTQAANSDDQKGGVSSAYYDEVKNITLEKWREQYT
ncbi:MAG TPA: hypothetical protein VJ991_11475 [Balneolales bacterium]|nr:hypothetical protein [Balneolales bacterium]